MKITKLLILALSILTFSFTYAQKKGNKRSGGNKNYVQKNCRYTMNEYDFAAARQTIANASFSDTKLSTAQMISETNCLSSEQIASILGTFSFETDRLEFAKSAYRKCIDKGNYFKVVNALQFSSSKDELNEYIWSAK
jgi:hypothetical protein